MNIHGLVARLGQGYPFAKLQSAINNKRIELVAPTAANPLLLSLISSLADKPKKPQLVIVPTGREAEDISSELKYLDPTSEVMIFPSWETLPHERLSPAPETVGQRVQTIARITELRNSPASHQVFVVTSIRAVLQPIVAGLEKFPPLTLTKGQDYLLPELTLKLVEQAYQRVDMVSKRGEFAVRGGILDVFPTTSEHAIRLEFFGDELEEIREFSVADQRSSKIQLNSLTLYPARELIITPHVAARAREMVHEFPNLSAMLEKISLGIPVEGMESLAPALTAKMLSLFDYLPSDYSVAMLSPEKSAARAADLVRTTEAFLHAAWDAAMDGAAAPIDLSGGAFIDISALNAMLSKQQLITISPFASDNPDVIQLSLLETPTFVIGESKPADWLIDQVDGGHLVAISCTGAGTAERLKEVFTALEVQCEIVQEVPEEVKSKKIFILQSPLRKGLVSNDSKLTLITEAEYYGKTSLYQSPQTRKLAVKRGQQVDPLSLKAGDYVVHEIHGIGRFKELVQRTSGVGDRQHQREYLLT